MGEKTDVWQGTLALMVLKTLESMGSLTFTTLVSCVIALPAQASESKRVLKVMTRNMDAGTDLNLIFAYYPNVPAGVSATLAHVRSTDIPSRIQRLADRIPAAAQIPRDLANLLVLDMERVSYSGVVFHCLHLLA